MELLHDKLSHVLVSDVTKLQIVSQRVQSQVENYLILVLSRRPNLLVLIYFKGYTFAVKIKRMTKIDKMTRPKFETGSVVKVFSTKISNKNFLKISE